jgi:hypothetical protein
MEEYKSYLAETLTMEEHREMNREAPEGHKFCNAICQDYVPLSEFAGIVSIKSVCNRCRSAIGKAHKAVENKQITIEDFKKNPLMFEPEEKETCIVATKYCNKCEKKKNLTDFYQSKAICKECIGEKRSKQRTEIEEHIKDIGNLKNKLVELEKYIRNICKDKLTCIISHFNVGRKSSDKKEKMIENIIIHFRKLQDPKLCRGGCGFLLQKELSTCEKCKKNSEKAKSNCGIRKVTFQDCIDDIISKLLEERRVISDNEFNKEQCFQICRKLGIGTDKFTQANSKAEVLKVLNDFLEQKEIEEKQKIEEILQIVPNKTTQSEIMLNGVTVLARESDGFINATMLCKAGGKKFNHWYSLEGTKELIKALDDELLSENEQTGIPVCKNSVIAVKGQGSWIHPKLAVHLAQWLSPVFALKVSSWVLEIALTGTVIVGQEKTNEQLLILQQEVLKEREKYKELETKHNSILYKRSYHKFKKGPIFYIISDGFNKNQYKVGIDDIDINFRLKQHRTSIPNLQVHFLVYTKDNRDLESTVLKRHEYARRPHLNHEWLFGIELENIIDTVQTYLKFIGSEYNIEEDIDKYNS